MMPTSLIVHHTYSYFSAIDSSLEASVARFWKLEQVPQVVALSREEFHDETNIVKW